MVFALKVIAPATLEEGYSFDATVDGRTFRVKVPEGGVIAGQEFVVHDSQEIIVATGDSLNQDDAPQGQWRKSIFSCIDTMCTGTFWMAFFCPMIQTAQLLTRYHLNWLSREAPSEVVRRTFVAFMIVFVVVWTFLKWLPEILLLYVIFYIVVQTRLRRHARLRYNIPGNFFFDFVITLFFSCCSTIQMVRHTHDEKEYPYDGCTIDGLPLYAPPLERVDATPRTEESPPAPSTESMEVIVHASVV